MSKLRLGSVASRVQRVAIWNGNRYEANHEWIVDRATFTGHGVREVAARPLVTGSATVVLHGVDRDAAAGDRVAAWA